MAVRIGNCIEPAVAVVDCNPYSYSYWDLHWAATVDNLLALHTLPVAVVHMAAALVVDRKEEHPAAVAAAAADIDIAESPVPAQVRVPAFAAHLYLHLYAYSLG